MQRNYFLIAVLASALSLMPAVSATAATPLKLNHQGYLLGSDDVPINGVMSLTFGIYDVPSGGAAIWTETHAGVTVADGLFTVTLGSVTPLSTDVLSPPSSLPGGGPERYLEIVIGGVPIVPRTELVASPYAIASSRVSGDVETMAGGLTATNIPDGLIVSMNSSDPTSQLAISQSGVKRFGIGIQQPESPLGTRMVIGDLDRDGLMDVVIADGASSMTLVDSTGSGGTVISSSVSSGLGLQPLGGGLIIHSADAIASSRSSVQCSPDSAVNSMSTVTDNVINNMRTRIDALEARLTIESDPTGNAKSSANIAATLNGNVVIGALTDMNGDGTPDAEVTSEALFDGSARHETGSRGGNGIQARTGEYVGSGATLSRSYCDIDLDGDGIAEYSAWQKVDNTETITAATVDSDDDGVPDVGIEISAKVPRAVLKQYFQTGDSPTQSQFMIVTDSSGTVASLSIDVDGDGNNEGSGGMQLIKDRSELKQEFQNGDIPTQDNVLQASCDADGSSFGMRAPTALLTWGTGLAFNVDATGPSIRMDQDSLPTFSVHSTSSSTECKLNKAIADGDTKLRMSAGQSDCAIQLGDLNSDGFAELLTSSSSSSSGVPQSTTFRMGRPAVNTALISTDAFSSSMTLAHASTGPGDKPTSAQFGNLIDSYIHLEEDGITRFSATSSTGVQLRDQFGNVRTSMSTQGIGFFDQMIGIGKTPVEKIDVDGGAYCDGTNWVNASDRNSKENFESVNGEEILEKISELEITKWNYKGDDDAQHIGPTAQDFKKTFGVGADDKSISTIDPAGIALAAIKELCSQMKEKDKLHNLEVRRRDEQLSKLQIELQKLREELKKK